jgi:VWFA-related protein
VLLLSRLAGVLCALTVLLPAQQPEIPDPAIKANVHLVIVPVTVVDVRGKSIDGLGAGDFVLSDEGKRQKIRLDTADTVLAPISLVIAIQSSGISQPVLAKIRQVGGMIQPLVTGERGHAAVLQFDNEVRTIQEFTGEGARMREAFESVIARTFKTARLIDAIETGVEMLAARPLDSRRVLIVFSESRDRGSMLKAPEVIERAQREGVSIYMATYSAHATAWTAKPEDNPPLPMGPDFIGGIIELGRMGKANDAELFTRATGGRHLSFATQKGLEQAIAHAGEELHSQYLLSFTPAESINKGFHRITVSVPALSTATIRARPGYWP